MRSKPWPGLREDTSDLSQDKLTGLHNVQLRIEGELRDRPGLGTRYALQASRLTFLESTGGKHLIAKYTTTLKSIDIDTAATTTIATGLNAAVGCFASCLGAVYYANGTDAVRVIYNGALSGQSAGITAPATAPARNGTASAATLTPGTHLLRYRFKNSATGYISNPSPALSFEVGSYSTGTVAVTNGSTSATLSGGTIPYWSHITITIGTDAFIMSGFSGGGTTFTLASAWTGTDGSYDFSMLETGNWQFAIDASSDAKVDKTIIEMTQAAGSTFYVVATIAEATTYNLNVTDTTLGEQQLADVFSAPTGYGHDVPPATLTAICEHKNRLFGLAGDYLYWSRSNFPEGFNVLDWAKKIFASGGDKPVALGSFFGDLYVFGSQGMARLVYTGDPATGMMVMMPSGMGVWSQQCVVSAEGSLFGFGRQGVFAITAIQPDHISQPIQKTLRDVDETYAATTAHGFFDPNERAVWFMYRAVGDTSVRNAVCFDLQSGKWSTRSFRHTIACSYMSGCSTSASYAYLSDANGGYTWRLEEDVWDCLGSMTSGVITATAGSTATVINTAQTLPTSPDFTGAILYNPDTGEEKLVASNTANSITIATLADTPAVGAEYYIGSIEQTVRSGHIPVHYINTGRRPDILNIEHLSVSGSTGVVVEVRYYVDYSSSAFAWTGISDPALNGVTVYANYAEADLDSGKAMVPVMSEWSTTIQWSLTRTRPVGRMRLLDCDFTMRDVRAQDVPS